MNFSKEHIKSIIIVVLLVSTTIFAYKYFFDAKKVSPRLDNEQTAPDDSEDYPSAKLVAGTVLDYGVNRIGDIDKILLQTPDGKMWLHFPPHTAKKVLSLAQKNASVTAKVDEFQQNQENETTCELLTLQSKKNKDQIIIEGMPPPPPSSGVETAFSGTTVQFQFDPHGHIAGFVLSGKLVELKPKTAESLSSLLQHAKTIQVKGFARNADNGAVNKQGYILVKPVSITIDNINYLVQ